MNFYKDINRFIVFLIIFALIQGGVFHILQIWNDSVIGSKTQLAEAQTVCGFGSDIGNGQCRGFITSGSTWNVPVDWDDSNNKIECIGAGGNGSIYGNATTKGGGGGGGGSYASISNQSLSSGNHSIAVAAGGSEQDTFLKDDNGNTVLSCGAGKNAVDGNNAGGVGGVASIGDIKFSGGDGGKTRTAVRIPGGGGGGSAGPSGVGRTSEEASNSGGDGGSGGGGANGGQSTDGKTANRAIGGAGGAGYDGSGGGAGGDESDGSSGAVGKGAGGGGGGGDNTSGGTSGAGGQGSIDSGNVSAWNSATYGPSGGGGGGGGQRANGGYPGNGGDGGAYGGGGGGCGGAPGSNYCDRAGAGGQGLIVVTYTPISADKTLTVGVTGNHVSVMDIPSTNNYVGGAFTFTSDSNQTVSKIIISETGTVDADANLSNVKLFYKQQAVCEASSIPVDATAFNTNGVNFSSSKATVSGTMNVSNSQICVYIQLDVGSGALDNETIKIQITSPSDITVSEGDVSLQSTPLAISGSTTIQLVVSIDISVSPAVFDYGLMPAGGKKRAIDSTQVPETGTYGIAVINNSNVSVDLYIYGDNTIGDEEWTLSAGNLKYTHEFVQLDESGDPRGNWTVLDYSVNKKTLDTNIAPSSAMEFDLQITTPNSSQAGTGVSVPITILATES
ncbi:MAG: hypothetical protein PHG13_00090 [Candidatus Pacebacteria bacterium]|nr:hypothetical protein [Candidatus Paceibacterota bacterium]MDD5721675.1 hypothetical protein [Candidatus Paceibacterota bacterium]